MAEIHENKLKLQKLILSLGSAMAQAFPPLWTRAVVGYFIVGEEQFSRLQFHIKSNNEDDYLDIMKLAWDTQEYDDAIQDIQDVCKEMRELCAAAGDSWTSMTAVLQREGYFDVEYSYETIDNYDAMFILDWQSEYLE